MRLHGLLQVSFTIVYVYDIRTLQETYISTACSGESFSFFMR
jgi:hypothetical protein